MFSQVESVKENYLLGDSIPLRYCEQKMTKDIIIVHFENDLEHITLTSKRLATSGVDQLGLVGIVMISMFQNRRKFLPVPGGTVSLFLGCSLMAGIEFVQFFLHFIWEEHLMGGKKRSVFLAYIHSFAGQMSTDMSRVTIAGKLLWLLFVLTFLTIGLVLSYEASQQFQENKIVFDLDVGAISGAAMEYPTVTICPKQLGNKWFLQKMLLDSRSIGHEPTRSQVKFFDLFFKSLTGSLWMGNVSLHLQQLQGTPEFKDLFPLFAFNKESYTFSKLLYEHLVFGTFKSLVPRQLKSHSGSTVFEVDFGKVSNWSGFVILMASKNCFQEKDFKLVSTNDTLSKLDVYGSYTECQSMRSINLANSSFLIQVECSQPLISQYAQLFCTSLSDTCKGFKAVAVVLTTSECYRLYTL